MCRQLSAPPPSQACRALSAGVFLTSASQAAQVIVQDSCQLGEWLHSSNVWLWSQDLVFGHRQELPRIQFSRCREGPCDQQALEGGYVCVHVCVCACVCVHTHAHMHLYRALCSLQLPFCAYPRWWLNCIHLFIQWRCIQPLDMQARPRAWCWFWR